ncbi:MAG: hypothetical protein AB8B97_11450 [Granulosicoccus sp.]
MDTSAMAVALSEVTSGSDLTQAPVQASYGASLTSDIAAFDQSLQAAEAGATEPVSPVARALVSPLEHLNSEAAGLAQFATDALASGNELTPSEITMLSVKSAEFMFHSQLTANAANRSADGIQQLFRQQS